MPHRLIAALVVVLSSILSFCPGSALAADPMSKQARPDYFISPGTVIIGCTAGAAAGALAAGLPVVAAVATGLAVVPTAWSFMASITVLGCVIGAASGGVAIGTAWLLARYNLE